jgi:hypothetical protein
MKTTLKKIAHVTLHKDYGGVKAWVIKETINGKPCGDPSSHKVLKREYFKRLHDMALDYLSEGWEIEIKNQVQ